MLELFSVILLLALFAWGAWMLSIERRGSSRELNRLSGKPYSFRGMLRRHFDAFVSSFASDPDDGNARSKTKQKTLERRRKLSEAGLESRSAQGKYLLFRISCYLAFPGIGLISYLYFIPYYATVTTVISTAVGLLIPELWLRSRRGSRQESIQRDLPFVLEMVNLGTSAGWDTASALERVIDALYHELPNNILIREFKRARWLSVSGYTWEEALARASDKIGDDGVRRAALAVGQALKQGGDRTQQLNALAGDVQRAYYSQVDKRLAALPVKVLGVTMMLMAAYFLILFAPAVVQVKDVVFG